MVDVTGHLAMGLLFAAPAWLVWGKRGALGFTAFTLATAMLPDVDLVLRHVLSVTHHGVTHTIIFVLLVSVLAGVCAARWLTPLSNAASSIRSTAIEEETVSVFATAGMLLGGLSHLFADMLSAPDVASPISPFWPVFPQLIGVDVIYYDSALWNFGLFAVAIVVHVVLWRHESYPIETDYRIGEVET